MPFFSIFVVYKHSQSLFQRLSHCTVEDSWLNKGSGFCCMKLNYTFQGCLTISINGILRKKIVVRYVTDKKCY